MSIILTLHEVCVDLIILPSREFRKHAILYMETDIVDSRTFSEAYLKGQIEAFIETLASWRESMKLFQG